MPIRPFLNGAAFGPEAVRAMSAAFETSCQALGVGNSSNVVREIIAKKIIELALRGERSPDRLRDGALRAMGAN
jgi:hypothetical protein